MICMQPYMADIAWCTNAIAHMGRCVYACECVHPRRNHETHKRTCVASSDVHSERTFVASMLAAKNDTLVSGQYSSSTANGHALHKQRQQHTRNTVTQTHELVVM